MGRFSGWLGRDTPELGFGRIHSVSAVEALIRCPHSYFLGYVPDLDGPPERAEDPGPWRSPSQFRSALHRLFFRFMAAVRERGEKPSATQHEPLLEQLLRHLVGELRSQILVRHEPALRADLRRMERSVRIFLRAESRRGDAEPVDFEVSFGQRKHGGAYFRDGVVLNLSEQLQLRLQGRIDRLDRTGEGYQIWNYKTGSCTLYERGDLLRGVFISNGSSTPKPSHRF
ncbi:MAG: PD-(D/E)XK nuclease family protein [Candidatus Handelsmanbacteria bacterium]|nr:PD-(D/E)XK nuclease family protein [Candidatus Handelsmanbacteria bacterium]